MEKEKERETLIGDISLGVSEDQIEILGNLPITF